MSPDFSKRSSELELLDEPNIPREQLDATLDELAVINRWLGGYSVSCKGLRALLPRNCQRFDLLDVGCGGGDLPRELARWTGRRGLTGSVHGIDLLQSAVDYASAHTQDIANASFETINLHDLDGEDRYDIVHTALTLHHFNDEAAVDCLRKMFELSRWGVVVNDIHRHPLAYHSIRWLTRCLSKSHLIRHDAPLSVLRAFRRRDLLELVRRAELPEPRLSWHWAFRWLLVIPKSR